MMASESENSGDKKTLKALSDPAAEFLDRWQEQMSSFFPERAHLIQRAGEYFVGHLRTTKPGKTSLRVAVLGSGPGLLASEVLTTLTDAGFDAEMTAVERDPAIVNLGRDAYGTKINFITLDLAAASWGQQLATQNFDVVLSAYTTHYFHADVLVTVYRNVASLLTTGGVFINVDFMSSKPQPAQEPQADNGQENSGQESAVAGEWDALVTDIQTHPRYQVEDNPYVNALSSEDGDPALEDHKTLLSAAGLSPVDVLCAQGASAVLVVTAQ